MTAKRFTETLSTGIVTDNVTGKEYECEMRIDDDLLGVMNNLHEENKQLKNDATVLIQSNQEYRKENARMQETLQKKEELLRSVLKVNDNLTKKIRELEEPSCRKCIHFSCDSVDNYCIEKMYDTIEDMSIAKDCKEYESVL